MQFHSQNNRGLHAAQDIENGEIVLKIPLEKMITLEMAY